MILTHLALFSFYNGASIPTPGGSVQSAYPGGIFAWFDGATGEAGPVIAAQSYYIPQIRIRRRPGQKGHS